MKITLVDSSDSDDAGTTNANNNTRHKRKHTEKDGSFEEPSFSARCKERRQACSFDELLAGFDRYWEAQLQQITLKVFDIVPRSDLVLLASVMEGICDTATEQMRVLFFKEILLDDDSRLTDADRIQVLDSAIVTGSEKVIISSLRELYLRALRRESPDTLFRHFYGGDEAYFDRVLRLVDFAEFLFCVNQRTSGFLAERVNTAQHITEPVKSLQLTSTYAKLSLITPKNDGDDYLYEWANAFTVFANVLRNGGGDTTISGAIRRFSRMQFNDDEVPSAEVPYAQLFFHYPMTQPSYLLREPTDDECRVARLIIWAARSPHSNQDNVLRSTLSWFCVTQILWHALPHYANIMYMKSVIDAPPHVASE